MGGSLIDWMNFKDIINVFFKEIMDKALGIFFSFQN
jgi:hypothetical protein